MDTSYLVNLAALFIDLGVDVNVYHDEEAESVQLTIGADEYAFEFDKHGDNLVNHGVVVDDELDGITVDF